MQEVNVLRSAIVRPANPRSIRQGPSCRPLGPNQSTQLDLPGETKAYPYQKALRRTANQPSNKMIPLPKYPAGLTPTYNNQQLSYESLRGKDMPNIRLDSRNVDFDLVAMFQGHAGMHKDVPANLSGDYQGSPWMYGPRQSLPLLHVTNASNFVNEYSTGLSRSHLDRKVENLINEGYEPERIHKMVERHLDDKVYHRLSGPSKMMEKSKDDPLYKPAFYSPKIAKRN